jgi:hypothetical protein
MFPLFRVVGILLFGFLAAEMVGAVDLSGCYETKSFVLEGLDGNRESRSRQSNSLVLRQESRNRLEFNVELIADFGHICTARAFALRQDADPMGEFLFAAEAKPEGERDTYESNYSCKLQLRIASGEIVVNSLDGDCHGYFGCGARTHLHNLHFLGKSRVLLGKNSCELPGP